MNGDWGLGFGKIFDLFYNQIKNKFQCKCKYEKYSFEKKIDIPIIFSKFLMSFTLENFE